jgi:hypothetical protein
VQGSRRLFSLAPRLRGEGRGEGDSPRVRTVWRAPSSRPSPRKGGEKEKKAPRAFENSLLPCSDSEISLSAALEFAAFVNLIPCWVAQGIRPQRHGIVRRTGARRLPGGPVLSKFAVKFPASWARSVSGLPRAGRRGYHGP